MYFNIIVYLHRNYVHIIILAMLALYIYVLGVCEQSKVADDELPTLTEFTRDQLEMSNAMCP